MKNLILTILVSGVLSILIYNFFDKSKLFSHELDVMDMKFIGFFITIIAGIISVYLGVDIITGFLSGLIMMQCRDLYRDSSNSAKTNGGVK